MRPSFGAALALLLVSTHALADDGRDAAREASRAAFRRGVAEAQAGSYPSAKDAFADAYRLFPHPSILLNLGIARWRTGEYVAAEQDLARFLSDDGGASAEEVSSARAAIGHVREHLGTLRVRVAPATARASVDGGAIRLDPSGFVEVRTVTGARVVSAVAEGHAAITRKVELAPAAIVSVDVTLPLEAAPRELPLAPGDASADDGRHTRIVVGWSLIGAAVAAAGVGTYAGVRALSLADAYGTPGRAGYQDPDTKASGVTLRTVADVAFAASIASAAVGAYLLVVTAGSPARGVSALVIGPAGPALRGSF